MDRADYWLYWHDNHARRLLQTIMGCVWPWTQIFCSTIILGVNSKRNIIYSRSSSESTYCILFYLLVHRCPSWIFWIFWSCSSEVSPSFWTDEGLLGAPSWHSGCALYLGQKFGETRLKMDPLTCWPYFRQFRFGAAGGHLCACDGCMTQVMAAERLVCTKNHRPC